MTTADSILHDLEDGAWHCGSYFLSTYRPTYAQRISIDLKTKRGLDIESRRCQEHAHRGSVHSYRLIRHPQQLSLLSA